MPEAGLFHQHRIMKNQTLWGIGQALRDGS
jgi:hypothetical protein